MSHNKETSYFIKNSKVNLRKYEKTELFLEVFLKKQFLRKNISFTLIENYEKNRVDK